MDRDRRYLRLKDTIIINWKHPSGSHRLLTKLNRVDLAKICMKEVTITYHQVSHHRQQKILQLKKEKRFQYRLSSISELEY